MILTLKNWRRYGAAVLGAGAVLLSAACIPEGTQTRNEVALDEQGISDDTGDTVAPVGLRASKTGVCGKTAQKLFQACAFETRDDAQIAAANCLNLADSQASQACKRAASEARAEALEQCTEVRTARDEVCAKLGVGPYDPVIDPANFVAGIDNPYTPYPPGAFRIYEKQTPGRLRTPLKNV